jgi:hypothetical protein
MAITYDTILRIKYDGAANTPMTLENAVRLARIALYESGVMRVDAKSHEMVPVSPYPSADVIDRCAAYNALAASHEAIAKMDA